MPRSASHENWSRSCARPAPPTLETTVSSRRAPRPRRSASSTIVCATYGVSCATRRTSPPGRPGADTSRVQTSGVGACEIDSAASRPVNAARTARRRAATHPVIPLVPSVSSACCNSSSREGSLIPDGYGARNPGETCYPGFWKGIARSRRIRLRDSAPDPLPHASRSAHVAPGVARPRDHARTVRQPVAVAADRVAVDQVVARALQHDAIVRVPRDDVVRHGDRGHVLEVDAVVEVVAHDVADDGRRGGALLDGDAVAVLDVGAEETPVADDRVVHDDDVVGLVSRVHAVSVVRDEVLLDDVAPAARRLDALLVARAAGARYLATGRA